MVSYVSEYSEWQHSTNQGPSNWKYSLESECHSTEHGGGGNDSETIHLRNGRGDGTVLFSIS